MTPAAGRLMFKARRLHHRQLRMSCQSDTSKMRENLFLLVLWLNPSMRRVERYVARHRSHLVGDRRAGAHHRLPLQRHAADPHGPDHCIDGMRGERRCLARVAQMLDPSERLHNDANRASTSVEAALGDHLPSRRDEITPNLWSRLLRSIKRMSGSSCSDRSDVLGREVRSQSGTTTQVWLSQAL
jgi:hypothetical protein